MKAKHVLVPIGVLLAAAAVWEGGRWRSNGALHKSSAGVGIENPGGGPNRPMLRPPNPNRKFEKLTPEQRVQLARRGPIGG